MNEAVKIGTPAPPGTTGMSFVSNHHAVVTRLLNGDGSLH